MGTVPRGDHAGKKRNSLKSGRRGKDWRKKITCPWNNQSNEKRVSNTTLIKRRKINDETHLEEMLDAGECRCVSSGPWDARAATGAGAGRGGVVRTNGNISTGVRTPGAPARSAKPVVWVRR